ncbi:exopolysaccharide phosphotransferase [Nocardioides psychrotolerans]|uniref:Glycosyltransferase involved in cell wall bisynthesis n=1 Tax=Nocardioides psychrotolerans TaxID=1005945 RepID=A0A1I3H5M8_9ACTN|nr:stealth conserved region 3 domain-containing protein [Nocardioides psychrotolerans]GEP37738.1 exopolysaccharide phosphotransferase [Nocardioides psychrotolerans]SFI31026.1 Glycosyltransferase involved in cell wall bisynthesis [Nocardioides psychrotolerans]
MRIAYLVDDVDAMSGPVRSLLTQAQALALDHDVRVISVRRTADEPHFAVDPSIRLDYLLDLRDPKAPTPLEPDLVRPVEARRLRERASTVAPGLSALDDLVLEAAFPVLDVDVAVTCSPDLLRPAVILLPDDTIVVHQEHRVLSDRVSGLDTLAAHAPRADVVAVLTETSAQWLRDRLGELAPEIVVLPNPLPIGFSPRSRLDTPLIMAAGRIVPEKQLAKLVQAFGEVADQIPDWRLRIWGEGSQRGEVLRQVRKWGLYDRVELPGPTDQMAAEWAKASICALSSRTEGFPLAAQEAMAAGVPVVSFDSASGPRELVEHERTGLLVGPESISGLAAALLRLATDADLRRRLGEGALRASRQYDAASVAERWHRVFADARARRAGRGRLASRALTPPARRRVVDGTHADITGITPTQARHDALALAVDTARGVTDAWLVVPGDHTTATAVVLPMAARRTFLEALAAADHPAHLCLRDPEMHGWPERRGEIAPLARELHRGMTSVVALEPWPTQDGAPSVLSQGCSVEVEFWESSADGDLLSPRRNRYADRIPHDVPAVEHEVEGVAVRTLPLMAAPSVSQCAFPIDVVYTWVDGSDPEWDAARQARLEGIAGTAQTRESSGQARFLARDELRYSLRSLHLFAPWVRRIHVVTAGQVPDWLDTSDPRINLVDHRDLLPADGLPTFNSHAIETSLHRIEGLAEHFLYFNDDFFLARPVHPETFFSPAGLFATYFSHTTIGLTNTPDAPPYLKAAWNNRNLLYDAFGQVTTNNLAHAPYPHRVSVLREIAERFAEPVAATARSPFRSDTDVAMLSSLAQHYGLLTGSSYVATADLEFVNLANNDVDRQLSLTLERDQDFICLGDHHDHALRQSTLDELLAAWYSAYFPVVAPWELA